MNKSMTFYAILGVVLVALIFMKYYMVGNSYDGFQDGVDTFTMYYASWCPHCKDVLPIFKSWGADKGTVQVNGKTVFVKLVEEQQLKPEDPNKGIVRGYPTFILNRSGNAQGIEFDGERTPEGWAGWLGTKL
jgi:thiol-disulfide isomerase/thioredoxin